MVKYFLQLSLVVSLLASAHAQPAEVSADFLVANWRNDEGLPHSIINAIVQSRDGYLWIATYVGLVRFDGVRFIHYFSSNVPELEDGRISALFEDRDGVLWIGLESGRLLTWSNGMAHVQLPLGDTELNQPIITLAQDKQGTIWFQTAAGQLGRINAHGFEIVARTGESLARFSLGLVVDEQGRLWVGTKEGLKIWSEDRLATPANLESLMGRIPDAIAPARDGSVWMFRDRQLWKLREGGIVEHLHAPENLVDFVSVILEAADGKIWLGASDGSLFCRTPDGQWKTIPQSGLRGANRTLCEDREGNIWRGSFGGGLTRISPRIFTSHELPEPVLDRYALTVCADPIGNLWGMLNAHTLARIAPGSQTPEIWTAPLPSQNFRALCFDSRNHLWGGGDGNKLFRLRGSAFVPELQVDEHVEFISALFEDSQTNMWVGFTGGAGIGVLRNADPQRWEKLEGIPFAGVRCIAEAADGAMWFGTHYGGASRWQDGQWTQFRTQDGLSSDYVRCLHADTDGTVWLGTMHGVTRWRDGKMTPIKAEDGLWNDSISHIADDGRGNFWMSSFGGVFRVKRQDLNDFADGKRESISCVGYNRNDGLVTLESPGGFQPAGAKTPDGRIWFPTVSGLVSVAPDQIRENSLPPPVWIEEVTVDNVAKIIQRDTTSLEIPPGKRRIDLRFTALSLSSPEKVRFRHRLEGLDAEWSPPDEQRSITYSHIPPGRYTFRVMACNNDGIWNTDGHSLELRVRPFFWQTWWFRIGIALLIGAAIAFAAWRIERWRAHLWLERVKQQHAIERERSRIAKDIHDDLGANLTQIVFLSQRVEATSQDASEVERWIKLIPATARRTIQSLDEIVWAINPKHDSLESLANYLSQFAAEHLSLAGIRCVLDVPTVLPPVALSAEVRHNLVLATREAVQNVVTHAAATEVRVSLKLDDLTLAISIADNGRGFNPTTTSGDGNGLHNMRRRLESIGGSAEIKSNPGSGTKVTLTVPRTHLHGRVIGEGEVPA